VTSTTNLRRTDAYGTVHGVPQLPDGFTDVFDSYLVQSGGLNLHAVIGGEGPPLLLLGGWPQSWYAWRQLMLPLSKRFTVIAADPRGVGVSDKPEGGYDSTTLAGDMFALMDALGHDSFAMVGHDIGMWVGYAMAHEQPGRIVRIALGEANIPGISSSLPLLPDARGVSDFLWHFNFNRALGVNEELVVGREAIYFGHQFETKAASPEAIPKYAKDFYISLLARDRNALRASFDYYRALDEVIPQTRERMKRQLTLPVLAFAGELACNTMVEDELRTVAEDVSSIIIPGSGHFPAEEKPQELLQALERFLEPYANYAEKKIIVVAGANGTLGELVCDSLLSRAQAAGQPVLVRALVRKSNTNATTFETEGTTSDQQLVMEPVDYASDDDLSRVCSGAYAVVSTLQGTDDVLIGVQSRLFRAAAKNGVRRFIPSDYALDLTKLPAGSNRNFDIRLNFHAAADRIAREMKSPIELTSIFQGAFTELLGSGRILLDYKKRRVAYFGSPDTVMEFTTWKDTAEYTAAMALDPNPTPRKLLIAGQRLTPKQAQQLAKRVTGVDFELKRMMSVGMLRKVIGLVRFFKPGKKDDPMPLWVGMQYAYCMALGEASPKHLDNDRYPGLHWSGADDVIRHAFEVARTPAGSG
jgi:pimeloyl-ACP methyl ester carboxylesterase/uncharacterized protein YbjT (DUF2867 family)